WIASTAGYYSRTVRCVSLPCRRACSAQQGPRRPTPAPVDHQRCPSDWLIYNEARAHRRPAASLTSGAATSGQPGCRHCCSPAPAACQQTMLPSLEMAHVTDHPAAARLNCLHGCAETPTATIPRPTESRCAAYCSLRFEAQRPALLRRIRHPAKLPAQLSRRSRASKLLVNVLTPTRSRRSASPAGRGWRKPRQIGAADSLFRPPRGAGSPSEEEDGQDPQYGCRRCCHPLSSVAYLAALRDATSNSRRQRVVLNDDWRRRQRRRRQSVSTSCCCTPDLGQLSQTETEPQPPAGVARLKKRPSWPRRRLSASASTGFSVISSIRHHESQQQQPSAPVADCDLSSEARGAETVEISQGIKNAGWGSGRSGETLKMMSESRQLSISEADHPEPAPVHRERAPIAEPNQRRDFPSAAGIVCRSIRPLISCRPTLNCSLAAAVWPLWVGCTAIRHHYVEEPASLDLLDPGDASYSSGGGGVSRWKRRLGQLGAVKGCCCFATRLRARIFLAALLAALLLLLIVGIATAVAGRSAGGDEGNNGHNAGSFQSDNGRYLKLHIEFG
uniref:Protein kinase domain-containing protein n=1 Tax=Macrostomum lignano TaxID=282301 RepID=A0A1I8FAQ1_9PLAT